MIGDLIPLTRRAMWLGVVVLLLALLALGCSGSGRLSEVTVPEEETSVQPPSVTDSVMLEEMAPVPPPGVSTAPVGIAEYDTARAGSEVSRVTVDSSSIRVVKPSGKVLTYDDPAYGETLDIRTAPDTTKAQVRGAPDEMTVMAECPPCPEGWWGFKHEFAVFGAFVFLLAFGGGALKIFAGSLNPLSLLP